VPVYPRFGFVNFGKGLFPVLSIWMKVFFASCWLHAAIDFCALISLKRVVFAAQEKLVKGGV